MTDKNTPDNLDQIMQDAAKKLDLDIDILRSVSAKELLYLIDHCPFLQITDTAMKSISDEPVKIITAESGWDIHDYGDAMSSSPGRFLFGGGDYRILSKEDEEGGEGGSVLNAGKGTIYKQAFDTAVQMVEVALQNGWQGVHVVDGHPNMIRAAWITADRLGMVLEGHEPTQEDIVVRDRLNLTEGDLEILRKEIRMTNKR